MDTFSSSLRTISYADFRIMVLKSSRSFVYPPNYSFETRELNASLLYKVDDDFKEAVIIEKTNEYMKLQIEGRPNAIFINSQYLDSKRVSRLKMVLRHGMSILLKMEL